MTELAELKIKPGCEAGSLYCGKCELRFEAQFECFECPFTILTEVWIFSNKKTTREELGEYLGVIKRCKPCLDAEVPQ